MILNRTIGAGLAEVMSEQGPEQSKGPSHTAAWERRITDRESSKCQGPETGLCPGCLGKIKEAGDAAVK